MSEPTEAGRYEWTGSQLIMTHCIHGLDLRLYPRCYLCRPEAIGQFATGGNEGSSYLPLTELARLRRIETVARALLTGSGDEELPDEEWDPVFLDLRTALLPAIPDSTGARE